MNTKQLVIISGKGGTGKTTLTASLASLAGRSVICDCDVDAADLHILLHPKNGREEPFSALDVAEIDPGLCTRCGLCEQNCRFHAISDFTVDPVKCEGCGVCGFVCPENAVKWRNKEVGRVFSSSTPYGPFFHGRLHPGASNSGRMVSYIRQLGKRESRREHIELILIDGSPGIGCPVISSIAGADMVIAVAEPTLSGIHDLDRVIALAEHFREPCAVIINKFDINPDNCGTIKGLCAKRGVPIIGEIPYDAVVTRSMVEGKPVVEYIRDGVSSTIREVWGRAYSLLTQGCGDGKTK